MGIARRGSPATSALTANGTSITVSVPAGVLDGDLLILTVWGGANTGAAITDPAGWTLDSTARPPSSSVIGKVYWRVAGNEPASYTITVTSDKWVGTMAAYSGVDQAAPLSASSMKAETVAGTGHTTNSITPGSVNDWVVSIFGDRATSSANKNTNWVPTAPAVERSEVNNNTAAASPWLAQELNDSNGVVGSTASISHTSTATGNSTANAYMWIAALRPAGGAAPHLLASLGVGG